MRATVLALLIAAAALTVWLRWDAGRAPEADGRPGVAAVDQSMTAFSVRVTDLAGQPEYRFTGDALRHYSHNGELVVDNPRLHYVGGEGRWILDAPRARADAAFDEIVFQGATVIRGPDLPDRPPLRVDTTDLVLYPDRRLARSDSPTTITAPEWSSRSGAFEAELDRQILRQTQAVNDHYAPVSR